MNTENHLIVMIYLGGCAVIVAASFISAARGNWEGDDQGALSLLVCWLWPLMIVLGPWFWIWDRLNYLGYLWWNRHKDQCWKYELYDDYFNITGWHCLTHDTEWIGQYSPCPSKAAA